MDASIRFCVLQIKEPYPPGIEFRPKIAKFPRRAGILRERLASADAELSQQCWFLSARMPIPFSKRANKSEFGHCCSSKIEPAWAHLTIIPRIECTLPSISLEDEIEPSLVTPSQILNNDGRAAPTARNHP